MLKFDYVNYTFMHLLDLDLYALDLHPARSLLGKLLRNLWTAAHTEVHSKK